MGSSPTSVPPSAPSDSSPLGAPTPDLFLRRHDRVRDVMKERQVQALVVSHLPNITYLSGFTGSAGLVILTADRLYLLVDFRYSAAVNQAARVGALAPSLTAVRVDGSYDRQLLACLAEHGWTRVGFEATQFSVARFDWIRRTLASTPG